MIDAPERRNGKVSTRGWPRKLDDKLRTSEARELFGDHVKYGGFDGPIRAEVIELMTAYRKANGEAIEISMRNLAIRRETQIAHVASLEATGQNGRNGHHELKSLSEVQEALTRLNQLYPGERRKRVREQSPDYFNDRQELLTRRALLYPRRLS